MYSTYEDECEAKRRQKEGDGARRRPNRIGQGIEFDYCCVHAALALREDGYETIMVNCNPETVRRLRHLRPLVLRALTLEDVLEIVHIEKPLGVIVQYGGQTRSSSRATWKRMRSDHWNHAGHDRHGEDRERFQQMLHRLKLRQPPIAPRGPKPKR